MNKHQQRDDEPQADAGAGDPGTDSQGTGPAGIGSDGTGSNEGEPTGDPASDAERIAQLEGQLRRSMADLANFQRRKLKDVQEARQRSVEAVAAELLPVLDNFHLALGATEQGESQENFDIGAIVEGMRMVRTMLEGVLERHGLSEIHAAGTSFDPNLHDAVGIDQASAAAPGTITQVVQRGYRIAEKVLRPSRVLVSGEAPAGDSGTDPAAESQD